jgi:hypothetical protein
MTYSSRKLRAKRLKWLLSDKLKGPRVSPPDTLEDALKRGRAKRTQRSVDNQGP